MDVFVSVQGFITGTAACRLTLGIGWLGSVLVSRRVDQADAFWLVLMAATLLMDACGGGGSGGTTANEPPPPTQTPMPPAVPPPTVGTSLTFLVKGQARLVDGTYCPGTWAQSALQISTCLAIDADTQVTVDGEPSDPSRVFDGSLDGSVAVVRGPSPRATRLNEGAAAGTVTSIDIQRVVVGTIESLDSAHAEFSVLGQDVHLIDTTKVDGDGTIAALIVGDRVAVSGFFAPHGEVVATAISHDASGAGLVLRGILHLDEAGLLSVGRMGLGNVWDYDFKSAGFSGDLPADGDPILVITNEAPTNGELYADSLQFIGGALGGGPDEISAVEGIVSSRYTAAQMSIEGRVVDCAFFHCEDVADAQVGTLVGAFQLVDADRVEVLDVGTDGIVTTAPVDTLDAQDD